MDPGGPKLRTEAIESLRTQLKALDAERLSVVLKIETRRALGRSA